MIPIPTKHFDIRYQELLGQRNMFKLYKKKCDKCGKNIQTTYALERPEIVYCEECYEKEIY
jgi:formylmethanofuran dehydrogenase subunit E